MSQSLHFEEIRIVDTTHSLRKIAEEAFDNLPPLTDMWNGIQVVLRYGETMRSCTMRQTWMVWNGTRWQGDAGGIVSFQNVVETLTFLNTALISHTPKYAPTILYQWATQYGSTLSEYKWLRVRVSKKA